MSILNIKKTWLHEDCSRGSKLGLLVFYKFNLNFKSYCYETWCSRVLILCPKCAKIHLGLRASATQQNFLGSLKLAIRRGKNARGEYRVG
jgi:hypothetical protein